MTMPPYDPLGDNPLETKQGPGSEMLSFWGPPEDKRKRMRETARSWLAFVVVGGVMVILIALLILLYLLIRAQNPDAAAFKDVLLSFIGFASGIIVAVLGFYFSYDR